MMSSQQLKPDSNALVLLPKTMLMTETVYCLPMQRMEWLEMD